MRMFTQPLFSTMKRMPKSLLTLLLCGFGFMAHAQIPANDDTVGAVTLVFNPNLTPANFVAGTTTNATASATVNPGIPASTCATGGYAHDVWYKFTPTSANVAVTVTGSSSVMAIALYHTDGSGAMVSDGCNNGTSDVQGNRLFFFNGLTPNTSYYARFNGSSTTATFSFSICAGAMPAAPANNEPINAISITPASGMGCTNTTSGTTYAATASAESVANICGTAGSADDDVWYSFTPSSNAVQLIVSSITNTQTINVGMYTGTPGSLTLVATSPVVTCNTFNSTGGGSAIYSYLTPGTTYYLRVYSNNSNTTTGLFYSNFALCLGNMPAPPANDEYTGATQLTINQNLQCASTTAGTTYSATQSTSPAATTVPNGTSSTSCNRYSATITPTPYGTDDDVWFKFNSGTGTNFQMTLALSNSTGSPTLNAALYTGSGVPTYVTNMCGSGNGFNFIGLTANTNYYIRIYTSDFNHTIFTDFSVCLKQLPSPPVNDGPAGAITLSVSPDLFSCSNAYGASTYSATASPTLPASASAGADDDVWYKFTPSSNQIYLQFSNFSPTGTVYGQIMDYDGTSYSLVGTAISGGFSVASLTPNHQYYLRVFTASAATPIVYSTFTMCLGNLPAAPANDVCTGAVTITPNNDYSYNNVINASTPEQPTQL